MMVLRWVPAGTFLLVHPVETTNHASDGLDQQARLRRVHAVQLHMFSALTQSTHATGLRSSSRARIRFEIGPSEDESSEIESVSTTGNICEPESALKKCMEVADVQKSSL
jgi:hypothetical protein